jgi:cohesin loading factor subunit SCC2
MTLSKDDVNYTRYMAENFAAFDYKTQEEVLTIIKYLTGVLSTTGMQLLEIISPNHLLTHLHTSSQSQTLTTSQSQTITDVTMSDFSFSLSETQRSDVSLVSAPPTAPQYDQVALMRTSVIIAMVMLLKAHLKSLYSLSEDKCNKFVIGKKSAIGDKLATKRNDAPISWARLPYALTPLHTTQDAEQQKTTFIEIWNEDGLTAEPEEEEFL